MSNIDLSILSVNELKSLDAKVRLTLYGRRLIEIRKAANNNSDLHAFVKQKIEHISHLLSTELISCKRQVVIERYLEEAEVLLNLDI